MHEDISYSEANGIVIEKLPPGIFLNTSYDGVDNTMIIGWGGLIITWGRPLFLVFVRETRATYDLIEKSNEFSISVPTSNPLKREIEICGTKSLREIDKFQECNLTKIKPRMINAPIIGECGLHFECKVIYKQKLDASSIPDFIKERYYKKGAFHTLYYGEIIDKYIFRKD